VKPRLGFPAGLTTVFLAAVLLQVGRHVMWRDELRTWQIARASSGLISLNRNMQYDAVPFLWNSIVFVLTRLFDRPVAMQLVHACIAAGVIFVVARWSPFPRSSIVMFALGYFPLYEYAVIARSYALMFLLDHDRVRADRAASRAHAVAGRLSCFCSRKSVSGRPLFAVLLSGAGAPKSSSASAIRDPNRRQSAAAAAHRPGWRSRSPCFSCFPDRARASPAAEWLRPDASDHPDHRVRLPRTRPGARCSASISGTRTFLDEIPITQAVIGVSMLAVIGLALAARPVAFVMFFTGAVSIVGVRRVAISRSDPSPRLSRSCC
jgi:hypothetical protein